MTALNVWIKPKAGYLLSDTGSYAVEDGRLLEFVPKVIPLAPFRAALGCSGLVSAADVGRALGQVLEGQRQDRVADLKRALPGVVDLLHSEGAAAHSCLSDERRAILINLVAWNPVSRKVEVSMIGSHATGLLDGLEPGTLYTGSQSVMSSAGEGGFDDDLSARFFAAKPERDAVAFICEQRERSQCTMGNGRAVKVIGGHALLTKVTARGVTQRMIHHWPEDALGYPVGEAPDLPGLIRPVMRSEPLPTTNG